MCYTIGGKWFAWFILMGEIWVICLVLVFCVGLYLRGVLGLIWGWGGRGYVKFFWGGIQLVIYIMQQCCKDIFGNRVQCSVSCTHYQTNKTFKHEKLTKNLHWLITYFIVFFFIDGYDSKKL